MTPRRILFWAHLCAGVAAGVVILVMCVTGVALAFERQIVQFADRTARAPVSSGSVRLPLEELVKKLPNGSDGLSGVTISSDKREPVAFAFGRERTVFLDPYNGRFLGQSSTRVRAFFASMERWHRALGSEIRGRGPRRAIADAANFVFLFLILSGFYLWLPRVWTAQRVRSGLSFRRGGPVKAALWNIHNVIGVWCAIPLFVVVLSGVIMSYSWANNLLYRLSGTEPPVQNQGARREGGPRRPRHVPGMEGSLPLDALFDRAGKQVGG